MSSLSISATDKDGKTSTFSAPVITREEISRAKTFLDTVLLDEGHDPTRNSAGGSITGAASSSGTTGLKSESATGKETAWTGKSEEKPKGKDTP